MDKFSNGARATPFSVTVRADVCAHSFRSAKTAHCAVLRNQGFVPQGEGKTGRKYETAPIGEGESHECAGKKCDFCPRRLLFFYFFNIMLSFLNIKPIRTINKAVRTKLESMASTTPMTGAVIESTEDIAMPLPIKGIA